ncbi:hypothetical protein FRC17_001558 [Serendipita sp. 399]|nr:hypothetical protein FRC17_001558 [Serendipita sp. 399]
MAENLNKTLQRYATVVTSFMQRGQSMTKLSPIHRLPNETMVEIFGILAQDGVHSLKPLLLVGRRFSSLVTSTPSLWCNINVKIDQILQESNKLSISYIETCIVRSQRSFLHVDIDMTRCDGPCEYMTSVLSVIQYEVPRFSDAIELAKEVLEEAVWDGDEAVYRRRSDEIQDLVRAIVGPEGVHMRRWKSFNFSPPGEWEYIPATTWELFKYPTPNLETFVLDDRLWINDYNLFDGIFPDMTAVRHLTLLDPDGLDSVPISHHLLTAVIEVDFYEDKLDALSDCMTLQELTITRIKVPWNNSPPARERDLKLPSLRSLTLEGKSLRLLCGCEESMPEVRARSVVWVPEGNKSLELMLKFLNRLVVRIKEMEELVVNCERMEGLSLAIEGITSQLDTTIGDTLPIVRIEEVGK